MCHGRGFSLPVVCNDSFQSIPCLINRSFPGGLRVLVEFTFMLSVPCGGGEAMPCGRQPRARSQLVQPGTRNAQLAFRAQTVHFSPSGTLRSGRCGSLALRHAPALASPPPLMTVTEIIRALGSREREAPTARIPLRKVESTTTRTREPGQSQRRGCAERRTPGAKRSERTGVRSDRTPQRARECRD